MNDLYFPGMQETDKAKLSQYVTINNEKTGKPDKIQLGVLLNALGLVTTTTLPPTTPIEVTYSEATTLIDNSNLEVGSHYTITDKADGGITLLAISADKFSLEGQGVFLNPDFQAVGDYSGLISYNVTRGVWYEDGENLGVFVNGDVVFWNGLHYRLYDDQSVNLTNPSLNAGAYQLLSKSVANGYIEEVDFILYDFENDAIKMRMDKRQNVIFHESSIRHFQWGNTNVLGNKNVSKSNFDIINQRGTFAYNMMLSSCNVTCGNTHEGEVNGCSFGSGSYICNFEAGQGLLACYIAKSNATFTFDGTKYYEGYRADEISSNFLADLDSSNYDGHTDTLTIPANLNYIGIFNLNFGNNIKKIVNLPPYDTTFYIGLSYGMDFEHTPILTAVNNDLISDAAATNKLFGDNGDFIIFRTKEIAGGVVINQRINAVIAA